jgi:hypothetical protein
VRPGGNCENISHEENQENKSGHENSAYGGLENPPPPTKKLEGLGKTEKRFRQEKMRKIEKISARGRGIKKNYKTPVSDGLL